MGKTLVIAEKPSVASDLARVLGKFERHGDYFENDEYVISSAIGHLLELEAPAGVEPLRGKWQLKNLPVLPDHFDLKPISKTEPRLKLIKKLVKRADIDGLINACDAGREGELIFRNLVRASASQKPIRRLWLQSMTRESILTAFSNLRSDEELLPLSAAAISRSESDWLVGINCTRALSALNSRGGGFQKTTAGRVQTPTLAILVDREERIRQFDPKAYFEVHADFSVAAGLYRGRWFDEKFEKGPDEEKKPERIWTRERAEEIVARCEGKSGAVEEQKKPQTQQAPLLYDLTTLQREANARFGLSAGRTLQIAQALYERHKVLTYPRTDSRHLPEDYLGTAKRVLGELEDPALAGFAVRAADNGWVRPNKRVFNNAKVSDHFAIVPTGTSTKSLDDFQLKIFDMVARRFVAVFYPAAQIELTTRVTRVASDAFRSDGKVIVQPGWLEVYGKQAESDEESGKMLVPVKPGELAKVETVEVKDCQTKPPPRYNEATLLSAMEGAGKLIEDEELREAMREKGLGTPATRAAIIEGLIFEGYIERQKRDLIALPKGISLITLLRNLKAEVLCKPELTGEWEYKLKQMEHGRMGRDRFMEEIRQLTSDIVERVKGFGDKPIEGNYILLDAACPKCGGTGFQEDFKGYDCKGCGLRVWKTLAGREFSPEEVKAILETRKIGPIEGFVSKMGRKFAAEVVLDDEFKTTFKFADNPNGDSASEPVDLSAATVLGDCPVCGKGKVFALPKAFACENALPPKKACAMRMSRVILQKEVPEAQVEKLLRDRKTDLIPGFVSKKGKGRPFSARLTLDKKGKMGFEFEARKPAPKKTKDASVADENPTA
jgi:DNA topoisomerase-3